MNTCKTALRILKSRKMYLVIYLGFIGIMMFAISWQIMRGSMTGGDEVFHPDTARVAVIDRDGDADGISSALRSYLALDGEMVDLADDSEALQQAVASNYVDLIAIVPHGFASDYQKYLDGSSNDQPTVETVVSYTSGAGSLSQLEVNEFLSLTRTAYLGQAGKQQSMETAMRTALDTAKADAKTSKIAVVQSPSADTDNTKPAASAFAGTIKTGLYPLLLVMPICTFLVIGTFNDSEIRRRLYSSPTRLVSLQMQEMLTCATFGLVVCVGYTAATLVLMVAAGVPFDGITSTNVALTFVSLLAYTLMAIACGFLLGSVGFSEMAVNAFANVFGLLCMFTSGMAFPIDMMPEPMIMIGKLLPGCACPSTTCSGLARRPQPAWIMVLGHRQSAWWHCLQWRSSALVWHWGVSVAHARPWPPPPPRSWPSKSPSVPFHRPSPDGTEHPPLP